MLASWPAHGTVGLDANGSFRYTPAANFNGTDSFTYEASDGVESTTATVTLTVSAVNDAPVCAGVSGSTSEDTPVDLDPSCSDVDGDSLTYAIVAQPAHGVRNIPL